MTDTRSYAVTRPAYIDHSHLVVRDLDAVSAFYQKMMGLSVLESSASGAVLGVDGTPLLTLTTDKNAVTAPRNAPGLYHTAFLMPNRTELGRWLVNAVANRVVIDGAADHLVSEAIYISDPEGNGIEIYADRPHAGWSFESSGRVRMASDPFDLQALYDVAPRDRWTGAVSGTAIGHIHLQVSNIPQAEAFFEGLLGMKTMANMGSAAFFATGNYHHHVGANIWHSRNAPARTGLMTGLSDYSIRYNDAASLAGTLAKLEALETKVTRDGDVSSFVDPWGMTVKLIAPVE